MLLAMLLRRDQHKGPLIAQHGEHDIAKLVHDSSKGSHLRLGFAFLQIISADNRILRLPILAQANRFQGKEI